MLRLLDRAFSNFVCADKTSSKYFAWCANSSSIKHRFQSLWSELYKEYRGKLWTYKLIFFLFSMIFTTLVTCRAEQFENSTILRLLCFTSSNVYLWYAYVTCNVHWMHRARIKRNRIKIRRRNSKISSFFVL